MAPGACGRLACDPVVEVDSLACQARRRAETGLARGGDRADCGCHALVVANPPAVDGRADWGKSVPAPGIISMRVLALLRARSTSRSSSATSRASSWKVDSSAATAEGGMRAEWRNSDASSASSFARRFSASLSGGEGASAALAASAEKRPVAAPRGVAHAARA